MRWRRSWRQSPCLATSSSWVPTQNTKDRWLRTSAWCAIGAAAYGWYQYFTIPPWDAFWVRAVGFEGYLGILEPTKMTVFSTMAERGVLGGFLGFAVVPMILSPKWRNRSAGSACSSSFQSSCLPAHAPGVILAAFVHHDLCHGQSRDGILADGCWLCRHYGCGYFGMGRMPGGEKLKERFSTLGNMQEDGSYQGRVDIYQTRSASILINPDWLRTGRHAESLAESTSEARVADSVRDRETLAMRKSSSNLAGLEPG